MSLRSLCNVKRSTNLHLSLIPTDLIRKSDLSADLVKHMSWL